MATRQARLDEFPSDAERPAGQLFEILCEDHNGTYALPFLCYWHEEGWWNAETKELIDAKVVAWRSPGPQVA
jgi:hypothetical protein